MEKVAFNLGTLVVKNGVIGKFNGFVPDDRPAFTARNAKEDLIAQIVERTTADKKLLAKRIALWVNRYHLDEMDLHALLKKADDPTIRNFTAFVQWSIKDKSQAGH